MGLLFWETSESSTMCNSKILLKISGSIAAYKSAFLASRLVQNGYQVQAVATPAALRFIGAATLEGLTGRPLLYNGFEEGKAMSHIDLAKWADLTVFAPATANSINKLAYGIADNLVTSLFLAHDRRKPYLIAPAMNTAMIMHPATQEAIAWLKNWGVTVLDPGVGKLACGDVGYGKMSDPEEIMEMIKQKLNQVNPEGSKKGKILITSGGTREKIDEAREISNISTGRTGATIADCFISNNWDVTLLHATSAWLPVGECKKTAFTGFDSLEEAMERLLHQNDFDAVIHLAAVSDYSVKTVYVDGMEWNAPFDGKIDSHSDELMIKLRKNHKILHRIKQKADKNDPVLVAFKFTAGESGTTVRKKIATMMEESGADLVVWNDADSRISGRQTGFHIFNKTDHDPEKCPEASSLAEKLEKILSQRIKNN